MKAEAQIARREQRLACRQQVKAIRYSIAEQRHQATKTLARRVKAESKRATVVPELGGRRPSGFTQPLLTHVIGPAPMVAWAGEMAKANRNNSLGNRSRSGNGSRQLALVDMDIASRHFEADPVPEDDGQVRAAHCRPALRAACC